MSTSVVGFCPPDAEWMAKKAAYDACVAANVDVPTELERFFNFTKPDDAGREIDIKQATRKYTAEMESGIEIELAKLSPNVKCIRFVNSY
jgi:hypothetical protein